MRYYYLLLLIAAASPGFVIADESLSDEIQKVYSFSPGKLSRDEIKSKSKLLDVFWNKISSDKKRYLPVLRKELSKDENPQFFYYDGSKLLLSLSEIQSDKVLAVKAIAKTNLDDIDATDYLLTVARLSMQGIDTSDAAFHILTKPDFKAFIVQHALTLGQDYCLVAMLMPLRDELYNTRALELIRGNPDEKTMRSLIKILWYSDNREGMAEIIKIANNSKVSKENRELAASLINYEKELKNEVPAAKMKMLKHQLNITKEMNYGELKELRRKRFNRVSDEALIELDQLTVLLKKIRVENALSLKR